MKRLIVGDLHFGVNEGNKKFLDYQKKSLQWIIELSKDPDIYSVDFLGDIFDNRNHLSHSSIDLFNWFFDEIGSKVGIIIVGNHDCPYKNTNKNNSVSLLNQKYFLADHEIIEVNDRVYVPWVNKENQEDFTIALKKTKAKICFGHFDISGFDMIKGVTSKQDSISRDLLRKFDQVISGHYHNFSRKENIIYIGSPYQINFSDLGVKKFVATLENSNLEFIENPYVYFVNEKIESEDVLPDIDFLIDKKVKLDINCERTIKIEKWLAKLIEVNNDVKINDNFSFISVNEKNVNVKTENFLDMWKDFLEEGIEDKEELNDLFMEEYQKLCKI
ncbi:MAG: metallophosphoesterase [Bacteroidales bacterium]|jgi:DNA repair exonuclease SbcCD nuclease subunit|nr:metallophosphoesterase [Bacteroidales bacterium]